MPQTLPQFTLLRAYEIMKEAAKFSAVLPANSRINTFAVLYEAKDLQKQNLGMKAGDFNTPRFWTNGSVTLNEISTPYPLFSVIEYPNKWVDMFKGESYTLYNIWWIVYDVIKEDMIGLTDTSEGRNITQIFADTEYSLRFIRDYFRNIEPFRVTSASGSVNGWYNRKHLAYLKTQGQIIDYYGSDVYNEFESYSNWFQEKFIEFNSQNNFERYAFQTKDNLAATRINITFPMYDCQEFEPAFYVDTKKIIY